MTHFYERNIIEIKNEYTTFLVNIITPFMYEGIKSVYNYALDTHRTFLEKSRHDPSIKSPGILKIFQTCLSELPALNNNSIEIETTRIREKSKCGEWFDDLVKAVIKSNIVLLTFSTSKKRSDIVEDKYHEKIEAKDFIHKCYIECARVVYNNPELFWHEYPTLEIKRNQRETCKMIKSAILEAIRKMLPMKLILMEYLKNEYVNEESDISNPVPDSHYMNIQAMVQRDLYGSKDSSGGGVSDKEGHRGHRGRDIDDLMDDGNNMLDDPEYEINGYEEYNDESKKYTESENLKIIEDHLKDINVKVSDSHNLDDIKSIKDEIDKIESRHNSEGSMDRQSDYDHNSDHSAHSKSDHSRHSTSSSRTNDPSKKIPSIKNDNEIQELLKQDNVIADIEPKKRRFNKNVSKLLKEAVMQANKSSNNKNVNDSEKSKFFRNYAK